MQPNFICPNCNHNVPLKHVGLFSSKCPKCNTKFNNVKSHNAIQNRLRVARLEKMRDYPPHKRPEDSKTRWDKFNNRGVLTIGSAGLVANTYWALFGLFIVSTLFIVFGYNEGFISYLGLGFGIAELIAFVVFLYLLIGKIEVIVDEKQTRIKRSIFGFGYSRIKVTKQFLCVKREKMYSEGRSNPNGVYVKERDVYGVGIVFRDLSSFTFGANLSMEEQNWLLYELSEYFKRFVD